MSVKPASGNGAGPDAATMAGLVPSADTRDLEQAIADFLIRHAAGDEKAALTDAAICLVRMNSSGHSCLPLDRYAGQSLLPNPDRPTRRLPGLDEWRSALLRSGVVSTEEQASADFRPLVLDASDRLYLYRHWNDERVVARLVRELSSADAAQPVVAKDMQAAWQEVFGTGVQDGPDWQRVATALALSRRFCIISGAPGTGKTTTIARLLKVYGLLWPDQRVCLAAPTGRAAARARQALIAGDAAHHVTVSTVHHLLGLIPGTDRKPAVVQKDMLIIDEASMISLSLMARLLEALSEHTRLVLVGDRDQLYSVAAGTVLADLCPREPVFSAAMREHLHAVTGEPLPATAKPTTPCLIDSTVILHENHRFAADSGIAAFAAAVNSGDDDAVMALLRSRPDDVVWHDPAAMDIHHCLQHSMNAAADSPWAQSAGLSADDPEPAMRAITDFRILAVLREGLYGVSGLNNAVRHILFDRQPGANPRHPGRQVMMLANDERQNLYNGEIGIFVRNGDDVSCILPDEKGSARFLSPFTLPAHDDAWTLTVHKSQGSEFRRVLLVLPPKAHPLLSRELIYTAVTRARQRIEIYSSEATIRYAVRHAVTRHSGLSDRLAASHLAASHPPDIA